MLYSKKPIDIPDKVDAQVDNNFIIIKGPQGELKKEIINSVNIKIEKNKIITESDQKNFWGLYRGLIQSMVEGVTKKFEKELEIVGVGYKAQVENNKLAMELGYSHPVELKIPQQINIKVDKNIITVSGADKQLVGQIAAKIRSQREPDAYKGKGIRYKGEEIKLKPGKKAIGEEEF